ncbi:MAG: glycosyltransferase family 2 protein [Pseudomonadota bacterium]
MTIHILMAVYNGGAALAEQLDSIAAQKDVAWHLFASDDGSSDNSRAVLDAFAEGHPVTRLDGPGQGGTANFLSLIAQAPEGWVAFCDHDDVWLPDKLARAQAALAGIEGPALYCARTWIVDADLQNRRLSAARPRPPGFANALVQNIASGNTTVLNPAGAALLRRHAAGAAGVEVHDWWAYLLITGAGGRVVHDDRPALLYRQHGANMIGANDTTRARLHRIRRLLAGDFADWNRRNIAALHSARADLTPQNAAVLDAFAELPRLPVHRRLAALRRLGLYRQGRMGQAALWLAALLGRM